MIKYNAEILRQISEVWEKFPHLRLGQLIENAKGDDPLFYLTDEALIEKLNEYERRVHGKS